MGNDIIVCLLFSVSGNEAAFIDSISIDDKSITLMMIERNPLMGEWGCPQFFITKDHICGTRVSKISVEWVLVKGKKHFLYNKSYQKGILTTDNTTLNTSHTKKVLFGFGNHGYIALWLYEEKKSILLDYGRGKVRSPIKENASKNVNNCDYMPNVVQNDLFDNYMKQFTYRYQVFFEHWDEDEEKWIKYDEEKDEVIPEFEYIEESLFDGTHDKLHDGGLMKYHEAGKPKKLALKWHIKKSDYSAYFWFEDEEMCAIFNKFYGQHPDTKTDFIIHIDPIKKKYELSLYRYGLKEPVIIPESAYQLIVFKSGFENYRSDNYNQPTGAWIW